MKRLSFLFGFVVLLGVGSITRGEDFVPGQIIIDVKHQYLPITPTPNGEDIIVTGLASVDSLNALCQVYAFEKITDDSWSATKGIYLLKFPDSLDVDQVASSYSSDIHIHLAGPNGIREPHVTPDDYYFPQQWGLSKMNCPQAWRYTSGSPDIIIQIIDGGTDYSHPDLVHNIWQNLGEDADGDGHTIEWYPIYPEVSRWILDPGDDNNQDDDGNGYYDDLVGWNCYYAPDNPDGYDPGTLYPSWGDHGTKTAGTAAAVTDNWISEEEAMWVCDEQTGTVAGTSWFSKIMIAKIGGVDHSAIRAIHYGRNNGAKIMSMSWGGTDDWPNLHAVLDSAYYEGILLIASAGNDSNQILHYPAAYENVVAVAATDINDVKKDYSCYGTWVDICAPTDNFTTAAGLGHIPYCYYPLGGTSCAAPFVAGVAALVWTCNLSATNAEVRAAIESTAVNIDGANPQYAGLLGSGRVNALMAVLEFRPVPPPPGDANTDWIVDVGDIPFLVNYLYGGGPPPDPVCVGDVNDDGVINVGDVVYLVTYLYKGGPAPQDGCD